MATLAGKLGSGPNLNYVQHASEDCRSNWFYHFLQNNSNTIVEIQKSLETAKNVSADYAQKFEIIEKGLQGIFYQIQKGFEEYKSTVANNLETILGEYTQSLTKATDSLATATEIQAETINDLSEELKRMKK